MLSVTERATVRIKDSSTNGTYVDGFVLGRDFIVDDVQHGSIISLVYATEAERQTDMPHEGDALPFFTLEAVEQREPSRMGDGAVDTCLLSSDVDTCSLGSDAGAASSQVVAPPASALAAAGQGYDAPASLPCRGKRKLLSCPSGLVHEPATSLDGGMDATEYASPPDGEHEASPRDFRASSVRSRLQSWSHESGEETHSCAPLEVVLPADDGTAPPAAEQEDVTPTSAGPAASPWAPVALPCTPAATTAGTTGPSASTLDGTLRIDVGACAPSSALRSQTRPPAWWKTTPDGPTQEQGERRRRVSWAGDESLCDVRLFEAESSDTDDGYDEWSARFRRERRTRAEERALRCSPQKGEAHRGHSPPIAAASGLDPAGVSDSPSEAGAASPSATDAQLRANGATATETYVDVDVAAGRRPPHSASAAVPAPLPADGDSTAECSSEAATGSPQGSAQESGQWAASGAAGLAARFAGRQLGAKLTRLDRVRGASRLRVHGQGVGSGGGGGGDGSGGSGGGGGARREPSHNSSSRGHLLIKKLSLNRLASKRELVLSPVHGAPSGEAACASESAEGAPPKPWA